MILCKPVGASASLLMRDRTKAPPALSSSAGLAGVHLPPWMQGGCHSALASPSSSCATSFSGPIEKCWMADACPAGSSHGTWTVLPSDLGGSSGQAGWVCPATRSSRGLCCRPCPTPLLCPAPLNTHCPDTSCTKTAPDVSLAGGQRPHCAWPWTGLRLCHTEPFCPKLGVRGRQHQGDRPFSCFPPPSAPQSEKLTLPRGK